MAHTIHYICKYTPLELFAAMGAECVYANHMPDGFGISEAVIGSNICGFGKSLKLLRHDPQRIRQPAKEREAGLPVLSRYPACGVRLHENAAFLPVKTTGPRIFSVQRELF